MLRISATQTLKHSGTQALKRQAAKYNPSKNAAYIKQLKHSNTQALKHSSTQALKCQAAKYNPS
jgi:hypothetical protein